ncbi:hypothetical protein, partial [Sulfobacillus sp. hq2]|uniref:hypothetical protein n=1 Tax=Sulfobacillus sp. hq2 TaxID=2039167 RepID=UPI001A9A6DF9
TPEQTNPVRTAGPVRGREKPKEIIVGFFNQDARMMPMLIVVVTPSMMKRVKRLLKSNENKKK